MNQGQVLNSTAMEGVVGAVTTTEYYNTVVAPPAAAFPEDDDAQNHQHVAPVALPGLSSSSPSSIPPHVEKTTMNTTNNKKRKRSKTKNDLTLAQKASLKQFIDNEMADGNDFGVDLVEAALSEAASKFPDRRCPEKVIYDICGIIKQDDAAAAANTYTCEYDEQQEEQKTMVLPGPPKKKVSKKSLVEKQKNISMAARNQAEQKQKEDAEIYAEKERKSILEAKVAMEKVRMYKQLLRNLVALLSIFYSSWKL